ncbi:MAG: hypothetical protein ACXU86_12910 [Archangium sp.]
MTIKKDLKKRVRERQEKTGESYTTARMHVLHHAEAGAPKVREESLREVTPLAEPVGLKGQVFLTPRFPEPLARPALERLREVLLATGDEPATRRMRAVLLRGEPDPLDLGSIPQVWSQSFGFARKLRLGLRGPSPSGRILSFDLQADGAPVAVVVALVPSPKGTPKLLLGTAEDYLRAGRALENPALLLEPSSFLGEEEAP